MLVSPIAGSDFDSAQAGDRISTAYTQRILYRCLRATFGSLLRQPYSNEVSCDERGFTVEEMTNSG